MRQKSKDLDLFTVLFTLGAIIFIGYVIFILIR